MSNIKIKASTAEIKAAADATASALSGLKEDFSAAEAAVNASKSYWQGEAAGAHRAAYQDMKENVEDIFLRLTEHIADLRGIAGIYEDVSEKAKNLSADLPQDALL